MQFLGRWRLPIVAVNIVGALYISGYGYARSNHYLVHYSGFVNNQTDNHRIAVGDLGLGINPSAQIAGVSYWVFSPLRWIESKYWYLQHPVGQPWPYKSE